MADEQTTSYPIYNQYIYKDGIGWVLVGGGGGGGDSLPDQTNNAGKFLTTDGTIASWGGLTRTVFNPALNPSNNKFVWTIENTNSNTIVNIYDSDGSLVYPNIDINQTTGVITITIKNTTNLTSLTANTYKAVLIG